MSKNLAAVKRDQIASRNNLLNRAYKSSIKTMIKKTLFKIADRKTRNLGEATLLASQAYSRIDKAVKKGVIPKNSAARKKAMLAQKLKNATLSERLW